MIAIFFNVIAVIVGSAIGALAKRGISEKYITVLNTAMGLAALVLGINVAMSNMAKSQLPVLFIFCLSFGGLLGTMLRLDQRMEHATKRVSRNGNSRLTEGITTAVLFCCVGTLSMMGPVLAALKGDNTYLMTAATLNLVTMIVVASSYGFGVSLTALVCLARRHLWYSQTFCRFHFRSSDFGGIHCGRCTHRCRRIRRDAHQRLQDDQSFARSLHAHALLFG